MNKFKVQFSAATAVGSRDINQDVFLVDGVISVPDIAHEQYFEGCCDLSDGTKVFAVCDGIGSFRKSGIVAEAALRAIREWTEEESSSHKENPDDESETDLKKWTVDILYRAREAMLDCCRENGCYGASSTIVLLAVRGNEFVLANIGDSPAFLKKGDGECRELSVRHNLATFRRLLNEEPGEGDERMLLYHLGERNADISRMANVVQGTVEDGDAFILCTDGVVNTLDGDTFSDFLSACKQSYVFVSEAVKAEGADNCTAVTVYVTENPVEEEVIAETE